MDTGQADAPLFRVVEFHRDTRHVKDIVVVFENVSAANRYAQHHGLGDFAVAPISFSLDQIPSPTTGW